MWVFLLVKGVCVPRGFLPGSRFVTGSTTGTDT